MLSRAVASFLLSLLLSFGCGDSSESPLSPDPIEPFLGMWSNEDPSTANNTRVQIVHAGDVLVVQMWGACIPIECPWGTVRVPASSANDGILELLWNPGFAIKTQTLTRRGSRLVVETFTRFVDNSGRVDYGTVESFLKP
jgi:hypothetical protein